MVTTVNQLRCRIAKAISIIHREVTERHNKGQSAKSLELPLRRLVTLLRGVSTVWTAQMITDTHNWLKRNHGV